MNGDALGTVCWDAILAANPEMQSMTTEEKNLMKNNMIVLMTALVNYFKTNAEIYAVATSNSDTVTMPPGSIVTVGSAVTQSNAVPAVGTASGTGTQTGTGKIQ